MTLKLKDILAERKRAKASENTTEPTKEQEVCRIDCTPTPFAVAGFDIPADRFSDYF